jgi:hypothetical protein
MLIPEMTFWSVLKPKKPGIFCQALHIFSVYYLPFSPIEIMAQRNPIWLVAES